MRHYGDITKLSGYDLPVVDCITGGSPCQDLSVAGNRAGLSGERSGLFMEQIRIVKEMREHDRASGRADVLIRPRYMVWENVPGAFSSNKGKDFGAVLKEIIKIAEPNCPDVPMSDRGGKWPKAGMLYDAMGRWSVAWRVHDAKFWGVPQRRKRIALVADFGGMSAPEILFERKGVSGDIEPCGTTGEGTAGSIESGTYPSITRRYRHVVYENHSQDSRYRELGDISETVSAKYGTGGNNTPLVCTMQSFGEYKESDIGSSLKRRDHKDASDLVCEIHKPVRRYTPLECERLNGYPDGWTDIGEWTDSKGKTHKESTDSARYKALGNSIALPFWFYLLRRISSQYERPATLGSLFDGIGGFPLCWERCNGKGTAIWASEIEEFPIAVTKERFKE